MPTANIVDVVDILYNLHRSHYHGSVEISFRDGMVVHVRETQSLDVEDGIRVVLVPAKSKAGVENSNSAATSGGPTTVRELGKSLAVDAHRDDAENRGNKQ